MSGVRKAVLMTKKQIESIRNRLEAVGLRVLQEEKEHSLRLAPLRAEREKIQSECEHPDVVVFEGDDKFDRFSECQVCWKQF
jgi:hypothetical protein